MLDGSRLKEFCMFKSFFVLATMIVAQTVYDYPDNSSLSPETFPGLPIYRDYRYQGVSKRLTTWDDYKGNISTKKRIHPKRQVWEYLYVACRLNSDGTRNSFYTAQDGETNQELVRPTHKRSREYAQPPC